MLVVSSDAESVTPPDDAPVSRINRLVGMMFVDGVPSIVSENVMVNTPVPSFSAADVKVGLVVSVDKSDIANAAPELIVFRIPFQVTVVEMLSKSADTWEPVTFSFVSVNPVVVTVKFPCVALSKRIFTLYGFVDVCL